jgi:tRNA pseudouridine13 synthase
MKLKSVPEDFQVEEVTERRPGVGRLAFYRLSKRNLGTLEAIEVLARQLHRAQHEFSFGGLKDRHALTQQYVTLSAGPPRDVRHGDVRLQYLGQVDDPFESDDILHNRFQVVIRELNLADAQSIQARWNDLQTVGVPNYFDDQRFGSLGHSGLFMAQAWCLGQWEETLRLALADPNDRDTPEERQRKDQYARHWGDWPTCRQHAFGPARHVFEHLCSRPGDPRGAITRIPQPLRSLHLAAFQSAVWNRLLAAWVTRHVPPLHLHLVPLSAGSVPFLVGEIDPALAERWRNLTLPLPSARLHELDPELTELMAMALEPWGLELRQMRVKYPRDSFFSKGDRPASVCPTGSPPVIEPDDLFANWHKCTLQFCLPRGCYATMLVKRLVLGLE